MPDHRYPRDYTDRQLLESIWRRLDGLAYMVGSLINKGQGAPGAHPDDVADVVAAWGGDG